MLLFDIGKSGFLSISSAYGQINSAWLFVCLMPACLVVESAITYIYFKRIKRYASIEDKSKGLKKFWKIMVVKIFIAAGLYWYALDYIEATYSPVLLNRIYYYYIYTFGVFIAFLAYMLNRWLPSRFGKKNQR
ncbi:MAG: hypothetical protein K9K65_16130 [Desulfarculaceae bacterium]|nr:hypothetical protein [Desulfarculaceae bacterium]MCF8099367.1 hypothetical protein [Desulfarculaceae bacterium]MCF8122021.1 hypothetical protein [Desulfarculaceae bacterium]